MAKQYKECNRELVDGGKWTELVKSLECGIYDIELPSYKALRSLQVIMTRFNTDSDYPLRFSVRTKYEPITLHVEVDKRK